MDAEDPGPEPVDLGGDPVCWADRVCPHCGRLADEEPPTRCPACGATVGSEPEQQQVRTDGADDGGPLADRPRPGRLPRSAGRSRPEQGGSG